MTTEEIIPALTAAIIRDMNLTDIAESDVTPDMPLFGEGLGLDSIDAVELVVLVEKHFKVAIKDVKEAAESFVSVRTLAEYIARRSA